MKKTFYLTYFEAQSTSGAETSLSDTAPAELSAEEQSEPIAPAEVKYGKQPELLHEQETGEPSNNEDISYKQFKEQFKEEYRADIKRIIDKRFKNAKRVEAERDELLKKSEQLDALVNTLSQRYGTDDLEQLMSKLTFDDSFLLEQAKAAGMRPEDYKQLYAAQQKAQSVQEEFEQYKQDITQQAIVEKWEREAQALAQLYPDFDLEQEVDNERFAAALQNGMEMRDAYQFAHFDEILSGAIQYTAQNVNKAVLQARNERAQRPLENGIQSGASAIVKSDVTKLSKEDMEEIDRLVLRGEKISF